MTLDCLQLQRTSLQLTPHLDKFDNVRPGTDQVLGHDFDRLYLVLACHFFDFDREALFLPLERTSFAVEFTDGAGDETFVFAELFFEGFFFAEDAAHFLECSVSQLVGRLWR